MTIILDRWGKSLAVRLPTDVVEAMSLHGGEELTVERQGDAIVIRRSTKPSTLEAMFAGKTPEEWQRLCRDHDVDWRPNVGREVIED